MKFSKLLARFAEVSEHGDGGYIALCPAHNDSRPSLRIWRGDDDKVRVTCRVGCTPTDVIKAAGLKWPNLFDVSGEGNIVSKEPPSPVSAAHTAALAHFVDETSATLFNYSDPGPERARAYAVDRFGLSDDLMAELELGYSPAGNQFLYGSLALSAYPRLTVPFKDFDGIPRGLQGRDLSGMCPGRWVGLRNPEGHRWALYGVFRGSGGYGATIVTEGPSDALTAVALGYDVVMVRGASLAGSPELVRDLAFGLKGTQVIVAGDNDSAGNTFTERLSAGLGDHGIQVYALSIPRAGDDLNAWRMRNPDVFPAAFHRAVQSARLPQAAAMAKASAEITVRTGADSVTTDEGNEAARILAGLMARYGESDAMNAHALVSWTNGRIKYAPGLGYYVWNGQVWVQSATLVRQEIHRMGAALVLAGATKEARGFTMTTRIDSLLTELRSVPSVYVDADEFDSRPDLLSFRNGVVDLRTGAIRPHNPGDMLTTSLPTDYDPKAECPRWERFIEEIMPGMPEMPGYLQRLTGYGITGHTSEQCFVVLWGKGANGKSVYSETLSSLFGSITTTTPFATFESKNGSGGIPNDIAALRSARLVMASEGESGKPMSEAILKRLSGKDRVTARFLNREFFTYQPAFLILLATNHKPQFKSQDEGLWRRVKLVPFARYFAPHERDYDLDRKLMAESAGITAWAVRGAVEWYAEGLKDPETVRSATKEYRETSDTLAGFFPDILRPTGGIERIDGTDVYNAYRDWCEAEGLQQKEVWSRTMLYRRLEERGVSRVRTSRGQALIGVELTTASASGPGIFGKG
ncbi:phage/plasmid primase, P4 family [Streptomyces spectabilis]|uniref:Toprim domain-containing protein n=1 Tax=Streptomyces spectabilis TaxID=68270 RepID=A0A516RF70_STRST|nr:phage/plasmid primase, P4 family [Streptomyces spectabilis]QDQ14306.1 toprim domain-containing protein [Streptomyces spectabilis]